IPTPEIKCAVAESRGRDNPACGLKLPFLTTTCQINCVQIGIRAAKVNNAVAHDRRRVNSVAGLKSPPLAARRGVHSIEITVVTSNINHAIENGGRGIDHVSCFELPLELPCPGFYGVEVAVVASHIDDSICDCWRREPRFNHAICFKFPAHSAQAPNAARLINAGMWQVGTKHRPCRIQLKRCSDDRYSLR